MIRPLFAHGRGAISDRLRLALRWWHQVLSDSIAELHAWVPDVSGVAHLFVDAASTPARCAEILFINRRVWYTDLAPPKSLVALFKRRRDKQITTLEILAIALGLSIIIHSDNVGAERSSAKGSARAADQNDLVHSIWLHAFRPAQCLL